MKTAEKKRREPKSKTFQADTLPMCSPNLQIEVDSKRSCSLWRALQACNGSVFVHLSMEQSRKAKQKHKKKPVNLSILHYKIPWLQIEIRLLRFGTKKLGNRFKSRKYLRFYHRLTVKLFINRFLYFFLTNLSNKEKKFKTWIPQRIFKSFFKKVSTLLIFL